jgi:hypothetical protein
MEFFKKLAIAPVSISVGFPQRCGLFPFVGVVQAYLHTLHVPKASYFQYPSSYIYGVVPEKN